jgi:hypothetical protein
VLIGSSAPCEIDGQTLAFHVTIAPRSERSTCLSVRPVADTVCMLKYRHPREQPRFPVEYPTASSPQAWATGTPFLFLRVLLGLEPNGDGLEIDPVLPASIGALALRGIPGRWGRADAVAEPAAVA